MITPPILSSGARLHRYASVDSTNSEAKRLLAATPPSTVPFYVLADLQTAGYGRRNRSWSQAGGDLSVSFVIDVGDVDPARLGQLSFVLAVAVAETLDPLVSSPPLLKWPNDVLMGGGKLAGMLLETANSDASKLIMGVGLNITNAPMIAEGYSAVRLHDFAKQTPPSPLQLLEQLDPLLAAWIYRWKTEGFAPIRQAWTDRAVGLGETLTAKLPNGELQGVFEGIDDQGALLLRHKGQLHVVQAGDIYFT